MAVSARLGVIAVLVATLSLGLVTSIPARSAGDRPAAEAARGAASRAQADRPRPATPLGSRAAAGAPARAGDRLRAGQRSAPPQERSRSGGRRAERTPRALLVRVRAGRSIAVRARPGGRVIGRLGARTEFGSPQVLGAVRTEGRWLGVASTARTDGRIGWIDGSSKALRPAPAKVSIVADLSRRRVELRRGEKVTARVRVAIGRPSSSTPTGRFTVTDKLDGRELSPYYGCCVLALSGTQPNLPPGWSGGNRLAIHGTNDPGSIGTASSAGCLRAGDSELRRLMRRVPLGTPVVIRN